MRNLTTLAIAIISITSLFTGCLNPFAPALGDPSASFWTDQQTVGDLLDNFRNAYNLQDSLRYSNCLENNFQFLYYDVENERDDQWGLTTDLKTTGGLFRNFEEIHLTWNALPQSIREFSFPDSSLEFDTSFNLSLFSSSASYDLYGFARFTVYKSAGSQFKITIWKDNSYF
jgi:hypothetical protein